MHIRLAANLSMILALLATLLLPASGALAAEDSPDSNHDDEIIYIDGAGRIRVIDPNVTAGTQQIQWLSPEGGWFDFAVGDVNNDGDMEIIAIGNGKLTVFDPVVQDSTIVPSGEFNLVPWVRLYEQTVPGGAPSLVGAGNMDINVAGDEIIYGYNVNEANNVRFRLEVLKSPDGGRSWIAHIPSQPYGVPWKSVAVGNINNTGSDDIVLIRDADYRIDAREVDNNLREIFSRNNNSLFTYTTADIGQWFGGGPGEVAMGRTFAGQAQSPSILVYSFFNGQWGVQDADQFNNFPHPTHVFFADINGSGDDELFWLRGVAYNGARARLFMINRGNDALPDFASNLDSDGGYKVGDGGDVDTDGREEVVIMRNNRIVQYNAPETGNINLFTDYAGLTTNSRSLKVTNLDGNGYVAGTRFAAAPAGIESSLQAGTIGAGTISLQLTATGRETQIPFTAVKEGGATWFTMAPSGNTTPASLFLQFNATNLTPGTYTDRIRVTTTSTVINQPFFIPVTLNVTQAPFQLKPGSVSFAFARGTVTSDTESIAVDGLPGLKFSAALVSKPEARAAAAALDGMPQRGYLTEEGDLVLFNLSGESYTIKTLSTESDLSPRGTTATTWPSAIAGVTVRSATETVPETITITADPQAMNVLRANALLVVIADERAGAEPENIALADVVLIRDAVGQAFLPIIGR